MPKGLGLHRSDALRASVSLSRKDDGRARTNTDRCCLGNLYKRKESHDGAYEKLEKLHVSTRLLEGFLATPHRCGSL